MTLKILKIQILNKTPNEAQGKLLTPLSIYMSLLSEYNTKMFVRYRMKAK